MADNRQFRTVVNYLPADSDDETAQHGPVSTCTELTPQFSADPTLTFQGTPSFIANENEDFHLRPGNGCVCFCKVCRVTLALGGTVSLAKWLRHPPRERKIWGSNSACIMRIFPGRVIPVT